MVEYSENKEEERLIEVGQVRGKMKREDGNGGKKGNREREEEGGGGSGRREEEGGGGSGEERRRKEGKVLGSISKTMRGQWEGDC